jgi:hypothetical protein
MVGRGSTKWLGSMVCGLRLIDYLPTKRQRLMILATTYVLGLCVLWINLRGGNYTLLYSDYAGYA